LASLRSASRGTAWRSVVGSQGPGQVGDLGGIARQALHRRVRRTPQRRSSAGTFDAVTDRDPEPHSRAADKYSMKRVEPARRLVCMSRPGAAYIFWYRRAVGQ